MKTVFFDNFFTSHSLLEDLTKRNFRACGTVRENRTNKYPLVSTNELKKDSGTFDYKIMGRSYYLHSEQKITHLQFRRMVAMALIKSSHADRKHRGGPTAPVIKDVCYDGVNHILGETSQGRRGCRSCNVNTKDQISLRDFKISVAACLCQEKKGKTKKRGRSNFSSLQAEIDVKKKRGPSATLPDKVVRTDEVAHWTHFFEKRGHCKKLKCGGTPKVMCSKCEVLLCFTPTSKCFLEFHTT
ncbi:hypothetical protein ANN_00627 [Periplaneta americana]|uniref:PiggyBac transposable element-derived protein domain-containing protein n=1 Tax=Periplaneta americana TaxID=6978 RepID=A0ABQ8TRC3_PERAM|nr:hypothetical protein ANN_00627 [Periplaneta americana]